MTGLIERLRERFAGDTLVGLNLDAVERRCESLTTDRKLALFQHHVSLASELVADSDAASAADLRVAEAKARRASDDGGRELIEHPINGDATKAYLEKWSARAAEFGLRTDNSGAADVGGILCAIRGRIRLLSLALDAIYKREGEPAALKALRVEHSKATAATWAATAAVMAARKARNEAGGTAAGVSEASILDAIAKEGTAAAAREALRRRLWDEWAATV
jgi:hypothetical protein